VPVASACRLLWQLRGSVVLNPPEDPNGEAADAEVEQLRLDAAERMGESTTVEMTTSFDEFGEPVDISLPEDAGPLPGSGVSS
jgi:hypothetical protein